MTVASSAVRDTPAVIRGRVGDIEIIPLPAAMGAEIRGLDLRKLDDRGFDILHRAYLDHLLLLVRGQKLSDADMVAVARRFGEFELPPVTAEKSPTMSNTRRSPWSRMSASAARRSANWATAR